MTDSPTPRRKKRRSPPYGAIIVLLIVALIICIVIMIKQTSNDVTTDVSSSFDATSSTVSFDNASIDNSIPTIDAEVPSDNHKKSKVMVIATGGTIAGIAPSSTDFTLYTPGVKSIDEMINEVSAIKNLADISTKQFANQSSASTTTQNLYKSDRSHVVL